MLEPFSHTIDQAAAVVGQERRTILVVGDALWAEQVSEKLDGAGCDDLIQVASDCFMALGQIAVDPPSSLIVRIEDLDETIESTTQTLRRLAPESRFLVLASPKRLVDAERAVAAGFDQCLYEPIEAVQLVKALGDTLTLDDHQWTEESAWLIKHSLPHDQILAQGASGPLAASDDSSEDEKVLPRRQAGPDQIEESDTELIDRLLQGDGDQVIRQIALQRITASVGGAVVWSEPSGRVPENHVSVPVGDQAQRMGRLSAGPPISIEQLQPWGRWLGRWLALKRQLDRLRRLAMRDETTDLWNRRYFNQFLKTLLARAAVQRFYVSLLVFDIDDFKIYNDRYGHLAGDEILCETAKLMQSLVREHDVVARIGGDEFAVIFWDSAGPRRPHSAHPHDPIEVAERFQKAICAARFPKLGHEAPGTLTISGGLAGFPWDGRTPQQLLDLADKMALQSKQQGKNAITFGPGAQLNCTDRSR